MEMSALYLVPLPRRSCLKLPSKKSENPVNSGRATATPKKPSTSRLHKKATPAAAEVEAGLSREEIAKLAYSFWEGRGYQGGSAEEDWLRAEAQLRGRAAAATA